MTPVGRVVEVCRDAEPPRSHTFGSVDEAIDRARERAAAVTVVEGPPRAPAEQAAEARAVEQHVAGGRGPWTALVESAPLDA